MAGFSLSGSCFALSVLVGGGRHPSGSNRSLSTTILSPCPKHPGEGRDSSSTRPYSFLVSILVFLGNRLDQIDAIHSPVVVCWGEECSSPKCTGRVCALLHQARNGFSWAAALCGFKPGEFLEAGSGWARLTVLINRASPG